MVVMSTLSGFAGSTVMVSMFDMAAPTSGDALAAVRSLTTAAASSGEPSWNVTRLASVMVHDLKSALGVKLWAR